jgi:peptidoglycan/xylan/chitin deacetylase (PgdA/CDA1 family)
VKAFVIGLGAVLASAAGAAHAADPGHFDIAITVDDLPDHGSKPVAGMTRVGIERAEIAALKSHHVPQAWGFVNAHGLVGEPDSITVLKEWREAGFPLGNHTYSHMALSKSSIEAWTADLEEGEPVLDAMMQGENFRFLRFPFLDGGNASNHDAAVAYLTAHHYRIADVSVSFNDWAYSETYNRCLAKGDEATINMMKTRYLTAVRAEIVRMKAMSQKVYGRMIPQVLLTHIGSFASVMLPQVLDELDKAGAHYVTLEQAESDPAYAETDARAGEGSLMERTAGEKGIDLSGLPAGVSIADIDGLCR